MNSKRGWIIISGRSLAGKNIFGEHSNIVVVYTNIILLIKNCFQNGTTKTDFQILPYPPQPNGFETFIYEPLNHKRHTILVN